ncbi:MAG: serine protease [Rikenellaceae bacterium]|nr:serine protease [Rikenellaceae bacterium]MBQ7342705.1 NfeD family protein [Alistipes sp.]
MFYIVLLILLGVLFLVAELLVITGSVIGASLALVCYGSAIYLAFAQYGTLVGVIVIAVILLLSLISTVVSLRAKTWRKLSLQQEIESASMPLPEQKLKAGDCGVALSRLAPAGKVEIDGTIYEARSMDVFIDQRSEVEVVGFENFTVLVKKIN